MKIFYLSISLVLSIPFINCQLPNYLPTAGLVGWWPFNENYNDDSGNNLHGTNNGVEFSLDRFNNNSSSIYLEGNGDFVKVQNNQLFNDTTFSISYWIHQDTLIYNKRGGVSFGAASDMMWLFTSNKEHLDLFTSCSFDDTSISGTNITALNQWNHFVYNLTGDSIYVYINNILEYSRKFRLTDNCFQSNHELLFGKSYVNVSPTWHLGKLDDIGYWNRNLTNQEISDLYSAANFYPINSTNISEIQPIDYKLVPNPAQNVIEINSKVKVENFELFNCNGLLVTKDQYLISENRLDIGFLSEGLYLINLNGTFLKFIKKT